MQPVSNESQNVEFAKKFSTSYLGYGYNRSAPERMRKLQQTLENIRLNQIIVDSGKSKSFISAGVTAEEAAENLQRNCEFKLKVPKAVTLSTNYKASKTINSQKRTIVYATAYINSMKCSFSEIPPRKDCSATITFAS